MADLTRRMVNPDKVQLRPEGSTNNPSGANGYDMDPRFLLFMQYYLDPESPTFAQVQKSGVRAGYSKYYAAVIRSTSKRFKEVMDNALMIRKAENNLSDILSMKTDVVLRDRNGKILKDPNDRPIRLTDAELLRVKVDVSKFVAERLYRRKYGKDEKETTYNTINVFDQEQSRRIAERILNRGGSSTNDSSIGQEPSGGFRDSDQPQIHPELAP